MHCKYIAITVFIVVMKMSFSYSFVQKGAKILYKNPKYISELTVLTFRKSRKSPYLTNLNATLLMSWDKNVTFSVEIQNTRAKSEKYDIKFKLCDGFKMKWIADWLSKVSDATPVCPVPAATYHMVDIEFPPKNIPLPLAAAHGSYLCTFSAFLTLNSSEKFLVLDGYIMG